MSLQTKIEEKLSQSLKDKYKNLYPTLRLIVSTIKDADVAEESATYVAQQILQNASSTLLVQANSAPQIALTLIKG